MRRLLLRLHAYLGLFCAPYLLIMGVSCFLFNHQGPGVRALGPPQVYTVAHQVPDSLTGGARAQALLDSLNLMGWYLPWDTQSDSLRFRTVVAQPGQEYVLVDSLGQVQVTARRRSLWRVMEGLHSLGEAVPRAPWPIWAWPWYLELAVYALLFWVVTGLYLWWGQRRDRRRDGWLLALALSVSLFIMLYLWLAG